MVEAQPANAVWATMGLLSRDGAAGVEYSFDTSGDGWSFTVGFEEAGDRFRRLARILPFAIPWAWSVDRFAAAVRPVRFLLRADVGVEQRIVAVTAYCRFPFVPKSAQFNLWMQAAYPWRWTAPAPDEIGAALRVEGPAGVAFRVRADGKHGTAIYFELPARDTRLDADLGGFIESAGWPDDHVDRIGAALRPLYPGGPWGVIGLDDSGTGAVNAIKFNPTNVPLESALVQLRDWGASPGYLDTVRKAAVALRARWLTYLGVKLRPDASIGGRAYFSIRPDWVPMPGSFVFAADRAMMAALRSPHY